MDTDFFETQLADLFSKQVFNKSFVFPDYEGLNLKNIIPQIGSVWEEFFYALDNGWGLFCRA